MPKNQKSSSANAEKGEKMTVNEAKRELKPIKEMEKDIRSVEEEIERLMAIATKMTTNYGGVNVQGTPGNKLEEAVVKIEQYRSRLSSMLLKHLDYKNHCLNKVRQIEPRSLQKFLIYYYFQDMTHEEMAEKIDKSYQWTYTMYQTALEEYSKI